MSEIGLLELILYFIIGGFAGYGLSAWLEDQEKEREARRQERWKGGPK